MIFFLKLIKNKGKRFKLIIFILGGVIPGESGWKILYKLEALIIYAMQPIPLTRQTRVL